MDLRPIVRLCTCKEQVTQQTHPVHAKSPTVQEITKWFLSSYWLKLHFTHFLLFPFQTYLFDSLQPFPPAIQNYLKESAQYYVQSAWNVQGQEPMAADQKVTVQGWCFLYFLLYIIVTRRNFYFSFYVIVLVYHAPWKLVFADQTE